MEEDRFCLVHMGECIRSIQHYVSGGRGDFTGSPMVQDAVLWNLQLVSAAAIRLSDLEKAMHPEVDWERVTTLFRELVADPWRIDSEAIWQCVEAELPILEGSVQTILRTEATRH